MKDITQDDLTRNIPLAALKRPGEKRVVRVGRVEFGGKRLAVMAGPCAVESRAQILGIARTVKAAGASVLRGGAYKPLTFPYRNERMYELGEEGLRYLREAGDATGLPVVTEVVAVRLVGQVAA